MFDGMRTMLIALILLAASVIAQDRDFTGLVIGITDGDTLTILNPQREQVTVRLAEIDAPEGGQPYGNQSRQALSKLAFRKDVLVRYFDTDQYGRTVARLYAGEVDISAEMVRLGAAWVYREYVEDDSLFAIEDEARQAERGLWGISEARIPPWEWRRNPGEARDAPGEAFTCGSKVYCREMTSCEEARFYLDQCGVGRLDGDGDGMPCEALCR